MKSKDLKGIAVLLGLSFVFLGFFYGKILLHPNAYLFSDSDDGLKAYYVYQYHIDNDSSWTQTKSINYPYGESHVYSDGQIFFADIFKVLKKFAPGISQYGIGFINELMLMSYVFCFVLLYLILRKLSLPVYYSVIGALCIGILSPQAFRVLGHLSLSYCFFVPLIWYLFIRFMESDRKKKFSFLIIFVLAVSPFVHGYYLLIGTLFIACLWVVYGLQHWQQFLSEKKRWIHFLLQVAVPSLLFQTYLHFYDHHAGRSADPYGMFVYTANLTTIFIPTQGPFYKLASYLYEFKYQEWEGWAYIGTPMILIALLSFAKILKYTYRKKVRLIFNPVLPPVLRTAIWASIPVLLFSFGYPFRLHMEFLLDLFPFLKQFRSLGRFAWVFYYVFTVYGTFVFYLFIRKLRQRKHIIAAYLFQCLFFALMLVDGISNHRRIVSLAANSKNIFQASLQDNLVRSALSSVNAADYQAILPLPFYHVGSEAQTRVGSNASMLNSMRLAYFMNLPMIASSCARTSQIEAANVIQLLSPPSYKKTAEKLFRNTKPILLTYTKENLKEDEAGVLSRAKKIYSDEKLELYELPYDSLFRYSGPDEIEAFTSKRNFLSRRNRILTDDTTSLVLMESFDNKSSGKIFRGRGAFEGIASDYNFFLRDTILPFDPALTYEVSFWYYNTGVFINNMILFIQEKSPDGLNPEIIGSSDLVECSNIVGNWSLVKCNFKLRNKGDRISVSIKGGDDVQLKIFADELMIRQSTNNVYQVASEENGHVKALIKNNLLLLSE
jgi:hypothetical protein